VFLSVAVPILVLALLIVVHEFGHFLVARAVGIHVEEFSVGFGPSLFKVCSRGRGTTYSLRLIPLGGFVRMAGMERGDEHPQGFSKKPLRDRIAVISAGPLMNFLLAVVLFILTFSFIGIPVLSDLPVVGEVIPGSPAEHAGIRPGDRIVQVADAKIEKWEEIAANVQDRVGQETLFLIERDGRIYRFLIRPQLNPETGAGFIGIRQGVVWERQGFLQAVKLGLVRSFEFASMILHGLLGMVTGSVSAEEIAGPVGITKMIGEAAEVGVGYLLTFTAILSINFALINLLPIPALDGSRLVFLLIEGIRGKPVDPDKENFIHLVGFAFLMFLIILITYNDLMRILNGD
jgi:regulator of sigma E protease